MLVLGVNVFTSPYFDGELFFLPKNSKEAFNSSTEVGI